MIPVLTAAEMKKLDQEVTALDTELGFQLMQKAARSLFDVIISKYLELQKKGKNSEISILCGAGNNGGDGILLAAYLAEEGYPVKAFILSSPDKLKNEAKRAYEKLSKQAVSIFIISIDDIKILEHHLEQVHTEQKHHFIIDALIGIGALTETREPYKSVLEKVQSFNTSKTVIAVDCPSATGADNAEIFSQPIKADFTISMGFPKLSSFFFPARAFYGLTAVANLNYPQEKVSSKIFFITDINKLLPGRVINGSKYDHGVASIIAGSFGMTGAAALCTQAAYRSGLGMVHLFSKEAQEISKLCPEAVYHKLSDKLEDNLLIIKEASKKSNLLSIGPGLSNKNKDLVLEIVKKSTRPLILDADGINAFENNLEILKESKSEILITPHQGEFNRLFKENIDANTKPQELINLVSNYAQDFGMTILLKGAPTIIALADARTLILPYGNSALATAGTGDVLSGIITGFASQLLKRPEQVKTNFTALNQAAIIAAYLHGKTAELASQELTEYSVIASDLINYFPKILKDCLNLSLSKVG